MNVFFVLFLIMNIFPFSLLKNITEDKLSREEKLPRIVKLPACQACKMLIESFQTELQYSIKKFSNEISQEEKGEKADELNVFNEIFANLCKEDRAKDQCHTLAEKCKDNLETWWMNDRFQSSDLFQYLCIEKLNYCCPHGHYGPQCNPCPGYPSQVCSNNGKCKGNGTRKGNGQCTCDVGYSGRLCDECAPSYYVSYKDENKMLCARCHSACKDNCTQAGARGCVECMEGWRMNKIKGCLDINECLYKRPPCKRNEFCVNNEGSYSCLTCDPSCDSCTGDGPDMCDKCAPGFVLKDNMCVNEKHYVSYSDVTRYLTYIGLCFATYIIFQNNPWAASVIGLCVAVYVSVSEYILGTLTHINFLSFSKTIDSLENLWQDDS